MRDALARAYQLNSSEMGEYIEGRRPLESLLPGKKSGLEAAIAEHPGRWSTPTIAAARALPFDERIDSAQWGEHLDQMEQALAESAPRRLWTRTRSAAPPSRSSRITEPPRSRVRTNGASHTEADVSLLRAARVPRAMSRRA